MSLVILCSGFVVVIEAQAIQAYLFQFKFKGGRGAGILARFKNVIIHGSIFTDLHI